MRTYFSKRDITAGKPQKRQSVDEFHSVCEDLMLRKIIANTLYHDGKLFKYLPKHDNDLDKEYLKPGLYAINPCSLKRDSHNNKTVHRINY